MKIYKLDKAYFETFQKLGCEKIGSKILETKAKLHTIYISNLPVGAANILKQDALSVGADLAVPRGTILALDKYVDVILVGTTKHLKILSKKELTQPFGLNIVAKKLKKFISSYRYDIKIMGVVNANDDSFYSKSRFKDKNAINQIEQMIKDGATIIDIGAVSSRPGSSKVPVEEELKRVQPICDIIKQKALYKKAIFSIDSYSPQVIEYALKSGFTIVNDITGLKSKKVARLVAKYDATVVIMHMQGTPKTMQQNPSYDNVIYDVDKFFEKRIKKAHKYGINKIILDVGIGFGKSLEHNLSLLKNMEHFSHFGYEVLIGASRKSMINSIVPSEVDERLSGTLAIHLDSISKGASIVRCHDVKEHFQAIEVYKKINKL